ncbi:MAG: response regulator [Burkholderiaceae bacterium]|nr:response regulator [Burkholderiaceae bacterium]
MNICLVEDDLLLGRAVQAALIGNGHAVVWLRLASDARARIANDDYDAIVLDLGLPDGDGLALLRELRDRDTRLPVIVVTARDTIGERIDGLDAGADDYLVKPFATAELLARLRALARRSLGAHDEDAGIRHELGDLVLDEGRHAVSRAGRPVALSLTEFALLRELVRHRNRVRTRRQLEAAALPESEGQSLDVHMSNLRRKLGAPLIRTVRGVGYLVEDTS